eukprot:787720-Karenia_brevis.AAC.1
MFKSVMTQRPVSPRVRGQHPNLKGTLNARQRLQPPGIMRQGTARQQKRPGYSVSTALSAAKPSSGLALRGDGPVT